MRRARAPADDEHHRPAQHSAARAGLGAALLPAYIGDADDGLVGVLPEQLRISRTCWLVVPSELADLRRVREISAALASLVAAHPHLSVRPTA